MEANTILVVAMFVTFMSLLIVGFPVAYCLWGSAMIFGLVGYLADVYFDAWTGMDFNFLGVAVSRLYGFMANWILVALPMFIYMGLMLERSGAAEKLMISSQRLFGGVRGGLTVTATLIGILMAASTGIIGASVVMLGTMSVPAMLKQGYSRELSTGTVCAAGSLGILIPPSIMLVIFADQLGLSVGDLFLGAVFPGLILGTMYLVYILFYAYIKPEAAPLAEDREPVTFKTILALLRDVIPPALLIVAVLGTIFAGIATVTEASGVGALTATGLALFNRQLKWSVFKDVLKSTFHTIGFVMSILVGANAFAIVLRGLGGDEVIEGALNALPFGPSGIVLMIIVAVFLLGFFLDWIEISMIILPLIGPFVAKLSLGIDGHGVVENAALVWFAVMLAVSLQTSFLTPPMGPAIFYLQGICPPDVSLAHIYRGVIPFVILQLVGLVLVFVWPELVTWLPIVVYG